MRTWIWAVSFVLVCRPSIASSPPRVGSACAESSAIVQETNVLSRAIREHARRQGQHEGFSTSPGDCLAYKYFRDVRPQPPS